MPEQAVVQAVRNANQEAPMLELRLPPGQAPHGMVLAQMVTAEGRLLLEARAHPPGADGRCRLELMPLDPAVRAWLEGES